MDGRTDRNKFKDYNLYSTGNSIHILFLPTLANSMKVSTSSLFAMTT